jgi:hypothetical protein
MNNAQRAAFRATRYHFDSPDGELLLQVDVAHAGLAALLRRHGAGCAAVVTAFNPQAIRQDDARNLAAQTSLHGDLTAAGVTFLAGRNEDPSGQWPSEPSCLMIGMPLAEARALAARYGQLAFLWTDATSAAPRLIETAPS